MRIKGLAGLIFAGIAAVMISGCDSTPENIISDVDEAKKALNTASSVCFEGNLESVNQKTDILADGAVAGHMEESGFINTKWTVTVGDETWFYVKIVTDEPINEDTESYVTAATYGYYDENDNCLGYSQLRLMKGDVEASYVYLIDADNNLKDYCMEETGAYVIDMDGNVIATADSGADAIGNGCHIQIDMEEGAVAIPYLEQKTLRFREQHSHQEQIIQDRRSALHPTDRLLIHFMV